MQLIKWYPITTVRLLFSGEARLYVNVALFTQETTHYLCSAG